MRIIRRRATDPLIPDPLPLPAPAVPEDEKIPRHWIAGIPLARRFVLILFTGLGFAFAGTAGGTWYAIHHSDQTNNKIDERSRVRDEENRRTQEQLDAQQRQINAQQQTTTLAICGLISGIVERDRMQHVPIDPLTVQFAQRFGCIVPPTPRS